MFHNTHAYIASILYNSSNDQLLIGSFLPDLAVTGIIPWEEGLHGLSNSQSFTEFVKKSFPDNLQLAQGVYAHNLVDDLSHTSYKGGPGFAFQNNEEITELIKNYYGVDEASAPKKAHNYIEAAFDYCLLQTHPEIQTKISKASKAVDLEDISKILSEYFSLDQSNLQNSLGEFLSLFTKYDLTKLENWLPFWQELEKLLSLKDIGHSNRKILLKESIKIVDQNVDEFIQVSLAKFNNKS